MAKPKKAPKDAPAPNPEMADLEYWTAEFETSRAMLRKWHEETRTYDSILLDEDMRPEVRKKRSRWNLFRAGANRKKAMLFSGQTPRVDVSRRFADPNDAPAREAAEMAERLLNTDIERGTDGCVTAAKLALADRLEAPGYGLMRARYVVEEEEVAEQAAIPDETDEAGQVTRAGAPLVPKHMKTTRQEVETDFVHYDNQLWSWARTFKEWRWWGEEIPMGRDQLAKEFGDKASGAPLNYEKKAEEKETEGQDERGKRASVWEVWDKENKRRLWLIEGFGILKSEPDPYGLPGFFPFGAPMAGNLTSSKYVPRSDYKLAQDLYLELDEICYRIRRVASAIQVKGGYPRSLGDDFQKLLKDTGENEFTPFDHWEMFAEHGGLEKAIVWLPIERLVAVLAQLEQHRVGLIDAIYQITGDSDIMRGQSTQAGATATEQRAKVKFGSIHVQALQDDFARFMAEHQQIRLHLIAKFFTESTILERCNCKFTPGGQDEALTLEALRLLKSGKADYRIELKAESVSLTDFAAMKDERMEWGGTLGAATQALAPLMQVLGPQAGPPLMVEFLKFMSSGMRGAAQIEGALERALSQFQQQAQQPQQQGPPDPKVQAEQIKAQTVQMKTQADMQREQMKHQNSLQQLQAEVQADAMRERTQGDENTREAAAKASIAHAFKMAEPVKPVGGGM